MRKTIVCLALPGVLGMAGCAGVPPLDARQQYADSLAAQHNWTPLTLEAGPFALRAYVPARIRPADTLTLYIEGDGLAWITSSQPSSDPTPTRPLALQLALAQPAGNAAYLGRPCQYGQAGKGACDEARYWTRQRFAPEVVSASNEAIDRLKTRFGAQQLTLVGYSGGAAIAALVAAQRHDVVRLVSVAGNLDHQTWTRLQRISPLSGSLNPADYRSALAGIPQWLLVGDADRIVPRQVADAYADGFPAGRQPAVRAFPTYTHSCCWAEHWADIWATLPAPAGRP